MKSNWKYIFIASLLINGSFIWQFLKTEDVDRTPPWHPFELNSELNLESIVENGYKFEAAPCGQVQYARKVGDTYIQYEVEVDCKSYEGHYEYSYFELDEENDSVIVVVNLEEEFGKLYEEVDSVEIDLNREQDYKDWQQKIAENKYYPWNLNEIEDCYQKIRWRFFSKSLGPQIDSLALLEYIESNDGYVISTANDWTATSGGSFMVLNNQVELYFRCFIGQEISSVTEQSEWQLHISSKIPQLNQKEITKEQNRRTIIHEYYKE